MNRQDCHGGLETLIIEWQIIGAGLNRLGGCRAALSDHLARRLDSDQASTSRFVGTGACANIQNNLR